MATLTEYATPETLPSTQAGRVGRLLGLRGKTPISDVSLASKIAEGLRPSSVDALVAIIGRSSAPSTQYCRVQRSRDARP